MANYGIFQTRRQIQVTKAMLWLTQMTLNQNFQNVLKDSVQKEDFMKNKFVKKLAAVATVATMAMGMSVSAFAAAGDTTTLPGVTE